MLEAGQGGAGGGRIALVHLRGDVRSHRCTSAVIACGIEDQVRLLIKIRRASRISPKAIAGLQVESFLEGLAAGISVISTKTNKIKHCRVIKDNSYAEEYHDPFGTADAQENE